MHEALGRCVSGNDRPHRWLTEAAAWLAVPLDSALTGKVPEARLAASSALFGRDVWSMTGAAGQTPANRRIAHIALSMRSCTDDHTMGAA